MTAASGIAAAAILTAPAETPTAPTAVARGMASSAAPAITAVTLKALPYFRRRRSLPVSLGTALLTTRRRDIPTVGLLGSNLTSVTVLGMGVS
jgi:hypothetical protein